MNRKELELDGTQAYTDYMYIARDNELVTLDTWNDRVEIGGWYPKSLVKKGWHATHRETWTYEKGYSRFNGGDTVLYRTNVTITEL